MFWQKEKNQDIWAAYSDVMKIHLISRVTADRVLVLAPHPDDDVLGCGGLLKSLSESGSNIKIIYFTDGSRGNREAKFSENLIAERENEAIEAGKVLKVFEQKFLRLPHNALKSSIDLAAIIRKEIEFDKPDLILAPSLEEPHPDHLAVLEALNISLKNYSDGLNIWLYEVFGTGRLNRLFIIDDFIETKIEALKCHKSQYKIKEYDEAILSLNKFRALSANVGKYAEGYYATGPRTYTKLFDFYQRHHESKI
ncbi:MAG: PIG-L family deacetylase [Candidatus Berkelbacteria bacterium]|nr:PIG-L family deacetylase [Candidatus Berkelbacteria bacterium]